MQMNLQLSPGNSSFSCAGSDDSSSLITTYGGVMMTAAADLPGASALLSGFQDPGTARFLVSSFQLTCGDFAWMAVSGCMANNTMFA